MATATVPRPRKVPVRLTVNGVPKQLELAPWTTLLDALRDHLGLTGTKKGCDHGQRGACTVLIDGRRVDACLVLAVMKDGASVTTIEGLASNGALHPLQQAFIDIDVIFVDEPDDIINPLGINGVGEIGIVGVAAATARAPKFPRGAAMPSGCKACWRACRLPTSASRRSRKPTPPRISRSLTCRPSFCTATTTKSCRSEPPPCWPLRSCGAQNSKSTRVRRTACAPRTRTRSMRTSSLSFAAELVRGIGYRAATTYGKT